MAPRTAAATLLALWAAVAVLAALLAVELLSFGGGVTAEPVSPAFGGGSSVPVRAIEHWREPASGNLLRRVECAGAAKRVSTCWVSVPRGR